MFGRSFALHCTCLAVSFSAVYSVVIVCSEHIFLLFKLPIKFRNALTGHREGRSSLASLILKYQRKHPHSVGGFFSSLKRNETWTWSAAKHPRKIELGTMSKNYMIKRDLPVSWSLIEILSCHQSGQSRSPSLVPLTSGRKTRPLGATILKKQRK